MPTTDKRVDAYLKAAAPFAKPILQTLRKQVHAVCPEAVETIKWGFPNFEYHGKVICSVTAFRAHCAWGLWQREGMTGGGRFSRLTSVDDLPTPKVLKGLVQSAMDAVDRGAKPMRAKKAPKAPLATPADVTEALEKTPGAAKRFAAFRLSHRREYLEWILEAKRPETRATRIAKTVAQVASGKSLNAKYER